MKGELLIVFSLVITCNACPSSHEPEEVIETEKESKPKPDSSSTNRETSPLGTKSDSSSTNKETSPLETKSDSSSTNKETSPLETKPDSPCPNQTLYCKLGNDNTMCKYCGIGPTCNNQVFDNEMTEAMKQEILDKHNELRAKVANGQEGNQPSATNMNKLIWDDELASNAQLWADQCPDGHDSNRRTIKYSGYVGQNMADSWNSRNNMYWGLGTKVQDWYDEVKDWPAANVGAFSQAGATGITGHYTQIVWAETQYVGCGVIYYKDQSNWAKNYPYRKVQF